MREHIRAEVIENLLACPRHCPDLPVLRLPHGNIQYQQNHAEDGQSIQVMVGNEAVDSQTYQIWIGQIQENIDEHQEHAEQGRALIPRQVGAEAFDELPIKMQRFILVCKCQTIFSPVMLLAIGSIRTCLHRTTSRGWSDSSIVISVCVASRRSSNSSCSRNCKS